MQQQSGDSQNLGVGVTAALASPIVYACVNLCDKVAIDRRVRSVSSYVAIVGLFDAAVGLCIAPLGHWNASSLAPSAWMWAVLSGISFGCCVLCYYSVLEIADASVVRNLLLLFLCLIPRKKKVCGAEYTYPALVCFLSWLFLHEPITKLAYVGIGLTLAGAISLPFDAMRKLARLVLFHVLPRSSESSSKLRARFEKSEQRRVEWEAEAELHGVPSRCEKTRWFHATLARVLPFDDDISSISANAEYAKARASPAIDEQEPILPPPPPSPATSPRKRQWGLLLLIPQIIFVAGNEFLGKIATMHAPGNNVAALNSVAFGLTLSTVLVFLPSARRNFLSELRRNWRWALVSETLTVAASWLLILSMSSGLSAPVASSLAAMQPLAVLLLEFAAGISHDATAPLECLLFKLLPMLLVIAGVILISLSVLE